MKKFKMLSLALALIMALSLMVGCSKKDTATTEKVGDTTAAQSGQAEAPSEGEINVALVTMDQMDQHWVNLHKGAEKAVQELGGVKLQWIAPDVKDDNKQIECVNNAVAGGAQVLMVAANGPDAITSSLKQAQAEGVKIIYVDSPANLDALQTLSTDNVAAGKTAGEEMLKELKSRGVTSGTIGIISVNTSTQSVVDRENGFRSAFEGTEFQILETQYSEGDATRSQDAATNFITQGVVGLFGTNEGTTVGVGNAIKETGDQVVGIGFDKSDKILEMIEGGYLLCTMAQNPDKMGYEGIKTAIEAMKGNEPKEKNVDTGVSVINKDNAKDFK